MLPARNDWRENRASRSLRFSVSTSSTVSARSFRFPWEKQRRSTRACRAGPPNWAAREAAYVGVNWTFAPMADLSRDSRWGRIVEGFGEDPYLGSVLTAASGRGFRAGGLATATKHFAGYGAPQGGRDYDTTHIPPAEMYDTYLPPFRAALKAGSVSFMAAFNALNGMPAAANPWLLTDVLREQWGFEGFVTSDWASVRELVGPRHSGRWRGSRPQGAARRRRHGHDGPALHQAHPRRSAGGPRAGSGRRRGRAACSAGPRSASGSSTSRTSTRPTSISIFPTAEFATGLARGRPGNVRVLQNRGDVLPVAPTTRSIAVIGPLADAPRDQFGPHGARGHAQDSVTVLRGIRERAAVGRDDRAACGGVRSHVPEYRSACRRRGRSPGRPDLIRRGFRRAAGTLR